MSEFCNFLYKFCIIIKTDKYGLIISPTNIWQHRGDVIK